MGLSATGALEHRVAAELAVQQRPHDAATWIALSQARQALVDEEGAAAAARQAFDLEPDNANAIRQLATCLFQSGAAAVEARALFERLLRVVPDDPVALHYLYYYAIYDADYRRAIDLSERLDSSHPGDPGTAARIARAYQLMGAPNAAADYFAQAADRCSSEQYPFPYGPSAPLKPIFTALAGDFRLSDKLSLELCQRSGYALTADLSNPRYPSDSIESIKRLQERVAGRDLFVFGFGPSLSEIIQRKSKIASLNFVSLSLSCFTILEDDLFRPIGKRVDFVCMTHPAVVRNHAAALREWMHTVPSAVLILPLLIKEYAALTGGLDFLLGPSDHLFWFDCFNELLPPSPVDPLHFPGINTLICALGVGLLGLPRRIFLFGFDGQLEGDDLHRPEAHYYRGNHPRYYSPRRTEPEVQRLNKGWLRWDTTRFNETATTVIRHTTLLFDLPRPPIYNVCFNSALNPFPRITFERFCDIVSDSARPP